MELYLKNIGKLKEVELKLNGISVIAGENNTGKSTVGRTLFAFFNSLYLIDEKIRKEKEDSITEIIDEFLNDVEFQIRQDNEFDKKDWAKLVKNMRLIRSDFENKLLNCPLIKDEVDAIIDFFARNTIEIAFDFLPSSIKEKLNVMLEHQSEVIKEEIDEVLSVEDIHYIEMIVKGAFLEEFKGQAKNTFFPEEEATFLLQIKDKETGVIIDKDENYLIYKPLRLSKEIVYIDNPFVLDEIDGYGFFDIVDDQRFIGRNHERDIFYKLLRNPENVTGKIIAQKKLMNIYERINQICSGNLEETDNGFGYREKNTDFLVNPNNLSTGLKTFLMIKTLLLNGAISENATIVLDEPEIHLHPKWQLLFAEIIILLQKEFNLHILLTTHSPYFLEALEVYSVKHGIDKKCNYYLAENKENYALIKEVTGKTEKIYKLLAGPFQELENVRYADDR